MKKLFKGLLLLTLIAGTSVFIFVWSLSPSYQGYLDINAIIKPVEIWYDDFGVPHIEAANEKDAYFTLGFVVARDRMFQLEMIKRLSSGRLSEVLGSELLESDKFFRTLGLNRHAEYSAIEFRKRANSRIQRAVDSYISGVNYFIQSGKWPLECRIVGISKEAFTLEDMFLVTGYMAFGFAEGFRHDPIIEELSQKVSARHMQDLEINWPADHTVNGKMDTTSIVASYFYKGIEQVLKKMPVSPWIGSNSWVVGGSRTKSGKPILCNDTHMGYSLPSVWYEININYPGFNHYGNYVAGFPFALIGHNSFCGNGLTMFENDDTDFYKETIRNDSVVFQGQFVALKKISEVIRVKDSLDVELTVLETPHGPLINEVFNPLKKEKQEQIALSWTYLKFPARSLEAVFGINHAKSMDDARTAAALIDAPGLNVMYADADGHIAWWAAAKLPKRKKGTNSKRFLNGASGEDEYEGYFEFEENPKSEDPEDDFVYSANNQPVSPKTGKYPGYYVPHNRATRINKLIKAGKDWDEEQFKKMIIDDTSDIYPVTCSSLLEILSAKNQTVKGTPELEILNKWRGEHSLNSTAPVIFYQWIYYILREALMDEMGQSLFDAYMNTHWMKVSYPVFLNIGDSPWWDNIGTSSTEGRAEIVALAWEKAIQSIQDKLGNDVAEWEWKQVHYLQLEHPLGKIKPLNYVFNPKARPIPGGNEVINNTGFKLDSIPDYPTYFGPAMRRIIDFSNPMVSWSILPSGQSGYFAADHYLNQLDLYTSNQFRRQLMDSSIYRKKALKSFHLEPGIKR